MIPDFADDAEADLAAERVRSAAAQRRELRRERDLGGDELTLVELLTAAAETAEPLTLMVRSGRRFRGVVSAIGSDCTELRVEHGGVAWVPNRALVTVESVRGHIARRPETIAPTEGFQFREAIWEYVGSSSSLWVDAGPDVVIEGRVVGCSDELVALRTGQTGAITYLLLDSLNASWSSSLP